MAEFGNLFMHMAALVLVDQSGFEKTPSQDLPGGL